LTVSRPCPESFPLFGYSLGDYDELFAEKLELLLALREEGPTTWSGRFRAPLDGVVVHPRPEGRPLPVWVAVGGTPNPVVRAGTLGLPMALAIIGGQPAAFAPLADLYRRALEHGGHDLATPLAVHSHGYIDSDEKRGRAGFLPGYRATFAKLGRSAAQLHVSHVDHARTMRSIELLATEVAPWCGSASPPCPSGLSVALIG
jgi:alkanesulfonate monooxygenase SsuD/methylene tetrahydromethanopterin reductase-like flavin-dependent oxidoreductase (luciferase family)